MKLSEKSVDWQLGYILGESLIPSQLPTLSTDAIKSNCIVEVPKDLQDLAEQKEKERYNLWQENKIEWEETFYVHRKWYKETLEDVYLKDEVIMYTQSAVVPSNFEEFRDGFDTALWDCDYSHYKFVEIISTKSYMTKFKLIKDKSND